MRSLSEKKREAMIEAAARHFFRGGYTATSMDAIAASANVSKRTLYNHFKSKKQLFQTLVEILGRKIAFTTKIPYRNGAPLETQLQEFVDQGRQLMDDKTTLELFRTVLAEHVRSPDLVEAVIEKHWKSEDGLVTWLEAARADEALAIPSTERAATHFWSLMKGIYVWPVVFGSPPQKKYDSKTAMDEAIEMFLSYYRQN